MPMQIQIVLAVMLRSVPVRSVPVRLGLPVRVDH